MEVRSEGREGAGGRMENKERVDEERREGGERVTRKLRQGKIKRKY